MVRRSKPEDSSPHSEISSSQIRPLSGREKIIARHLPTNAPHNDENPSGLSRGPPNKISGDRDTRTQLRKATAGNHRRRTRMGSGKSHQLPTPRTPQEASIPCSMEGIPPIRRLLGSRVGSLRSRPDRRLLRHTLSRPQTAVI